MWQKLGSIRKSKSGNQYIALGDLKAKNPFSVEIVVKDKDGNVIAKATNPALNVQNPRKRPGITEEQLERVPEWLMAEISLPPARE